MTMPVMMLRPLAWLSRLDEGAQRGAQGGGRQRRG